MSRRSVFFEDIGSRNVGWHQIWSELDPFKFEIQNIRQSSNHEGFGKPWDPF